MTVISQSIGSFHRHNTNRDDTETETEMKHNFNNESDLDLFNNSNIAIGDDNNMQPNELKEIVKELKNEINSLRNEMNEIGLRLTEIENLNQRNFEKLFEKLGIFHSDSPSF